MRTPKRTGRLFRLEYIFISFFVLVLAIVLLLLVYNFRLFDSLTSPLKDFAFTDFYYSKLRDTTAKYDGPIVIVNLEDKSRSEIAAILEKIQQAKPKVVGLDVVFPPKVDEGNDSLRKALSLYDNYVISYIDSFAKDDKYITTDPSLSKSKDGYVNLIGQQREFTTVRYYYPFYQGQTAFSSAVIKKYDPVLYTKLTEKKEERCEIWFYGSNNAFPTFHYRQVMDSTFPANTFQDKIVLVGYLGSEGRAEHEIEDKFFTPLNKKIAGRSHPDTYGVVIHANVLRMILQDDYIRSIPAWVEWLIAFAFCCLLLMLFGRWYSNNRMQFFVKARLAQLIACMLIAIVSISLYHQYHVKLEAGIILLVTVLSLDGMLIYAAFLQTVGRRTGLSSFMRENNSRY